MGRPKGSSNSTRLRIMDAAMSLFADKGFANTTTKDIAAALGIKDASLYNHFKSKQEIFDAAVQSYIEELADILHECGAMAHPEEDTSPYAASDIDVVTQTVIDSLRPLFDGEHAILLRHVLESNRYTNEQCQHLYQEIFIERPLSIQEKIFHNLVEYGAFVPCDVRLSALEFYGLPYLLLAQDTPWDKARLLIECHIANFNAAHQSKR